MSALPGLRELQVALQQHLLGAPSAIADAVVAKRGVAAAARLHVYHHAYRDRLTAALADGFGHTARHLGPARFEAEALAYVEGHPSTHASLRWYGAGFPAWLAARHRGQPEVGELAALDAALRRAFDGPDAPVLALADLAGVAAYDWATLVLELHPTAERLTLQPATLALWRTLDAGEALPAPGPAAGTAPAPCAVLVWRLGLRPHFRSLPPAEALALAAVAAGDGFGAVCDALQQAFADEDAVAMAGGVLRRWIDDGLLAGFRSLPAA